MKTVLINLGSSDPFRMVKALWTLSLITMISFQLLNISSQGNVLSPLVNMFFRITLENTPFSMFTDVLGIFVSIVWFVLKLFILLPMILYTVLKLSDSLTNVVWGKLRL